MAYKEKTCPKCGATHKKRGEFCSRSCGNARVWSAEMRQVFSEKQTEFIYSDADAAEEARWRINNHEEPEPVAPIRTQDSLQVNQFVQDGDIWTTD